MTQRAKLQAMASELRGVAAKLYDLALNPNAPGADEMTLAALVLWRRADEIEAMIVPPARPRIGWFAQLMGRLSVALKASAP